MITLPLRKSNVSVETSIISDLGAHWVQVHRAKGQGLLEDRQKDQEHGLVRMDVVVTSGLWVMHHPGCSYDIQQWFNQFLYNPCSVLGIEPGAEHLTLLIECMFQGNYLERWMLRTLASIYVFWCFYHMAVPLGCVSCVWGQEFVSYLHKNRYARKACHIWDTGENFAATDFNVVRYLHLPWDSIFPVKCKV